MRQDAPLLPELGVAHEDTRVSPRFLVLGKVGGPLSI